MIKVTKGDLLKAEDRYIVHQCNCVTTYGKGLSEGIFGSFPYADIYTARWRNGPDIYRVGSIALCGDGSSDKRFVMNLLGQIGPGKPNGRWAHDSSEDRLGYFKRGLKELEESCCKEREKRSSNSSQDVPKNKEGRC